MYSDEDLIALSALQHFLFCERQCALIHIEQVWAENRFTIEGEVLHKRAHSRQRENRPDRRTEFGMPIRSLELGLSGRADAIEYIADGSVLLVEYKRGRPKVGGADEAQLCAQAICLEEMRGISILGGALYYGKSRRRKNVVFDEALRERTRQTAVRLHAFLRAGRTPTPTYTSTTCPRCSLLSYCMPKRLSKASSVNAYFSRMLKEETPQ